MSSVDWITNRDEYLQAPISLFNSDGLNHKDQWLGYDDVTSILDLWDEGGWWLGNI